MSENEYRNITKLFLHSSVKPGVDLYIKTNVDGVPKYILYCRGDEAFSSEKRENLIKRNIDVLFTPVKSSKTPVRRQRENPKTTIVYPKTIIEYKEENPEERMKEIFRIIKDLTPDILYNPESGIDLGRIKYWMDNTLKLILHDEDALSSMLKANLDEYTYTHSVNLAMLGLLFGKHIALSLHSLNSLGVGMLLHDLGKYEIPLEILNKSNSLTEDEFKIVKKHPEAGVKFLAGNENIDKESLKLIIQHHENYDGTGYPHGLAGNDIHLFGKISRIIDVYDSLTTNRSYEKAKRPFSALAEMQEKMSNCFDTELLKEFIHFMGAMDSRKVEERRSGGKLYYSPKITSVT